MDAYIDGINNICEAHQRVAQRYIDDGSIEDACPPLKALLYIMATGSFEGKGIDDPAIRAMFTRDELLKADWYQDRLRLKQVREVKLFERHVASLKDALAREGYEEQAAQLGLRQRLQQAEEQLAKLQSQAYPHRPARHLGADPCNVAVAAEELGTVASA